MGNALTVLNYSTLPLGDLTHQCSVENFKLNPWWVTRFVDGSYLSYSSKLLTTRYYSAASKKAVIRTELGDSKLDPNWITGFVDGEGCFSVSIIKYQKLKLGWRVKPSFTIVLHERDKAVFEAIKKSLGVGKISQQGPNTLQFRIQSLKEFETVIIHFDKFPLNT